MTRVEHFEQITKQMADTYCAKNSDYSNSFAEVRKRHENSVVIRLWDKLLRLEQLMKPGYKAQVKDEKIEDTLIDLANYSVMELVERAVDTEETVNDCYDISNNEALIKEVNRSPDEIKTPFLDGFESFKAWKPIWAIKDRTEFFNQEVALSDAEVWYNTVGDYYALTIEEAIDFENAKSLEAWLENIETALFRFVKTREPDTTYELTWQDCLGASDNIDGSTLTEVAEKFSFYVDNIIRHFKEKEEYGL